MTPGLSAAESLAAGLPRLVLAAERLAHTAAAGIHGRRRPGIGESFWQFRDFRPGDDARRIDWRRSASSERLYLREREAEAQANIVLSLSEHPGMAYRSAPGQPSKRERACLLLLALASLLLRGGERVSLAGRTLPLSGRVALPRLATALAEPGGKPMQADPRARVIAFGDFLQPDPVFTAAPGGAVIQVLDPAECDFPFSGRIVIAGCAGEPEIEAARAEGWAAAYRDRLAAQQEAVRRAAQRAGQTPLFHRTDAPPAPALAALYQALGRA